MGGISFPSQQKTWHCLNRVQLGTVSAPAGKDASAENTKAQRCRRIQGAQENVGSRVQREYGQKSISDVPGAPQSLSHSSEEVVSPSPFIISFISSYSFFLYWYFKIFGRKIQIWKQTWLHTIYKSSHITTKDKHMVFSKHDFFFLSVDFNSCFLSSHGMLRIKILLFLRTYVPNTYVHASTQTGNFPAFCWKLI